jgi:acyl carrier protein
MLQKVREIIADVTENAVERISEDSSHRNVEGWDSLAQINIIVTIEMTFGVSFGPEEIHTLNSARKIVQALHARDMRA